MCVCILFPADSLPSKSSSYNGDSIRQKIP